MKFPTLVLLLNSTWNLSNLKCIRFGQMRTRGGSGSGGGGERSLFSYSKYSTRVVRSVLMHVVVEDLNVNVVFFLFLFDAK